MDTPIQFLVVFLIQTSFANAASESLVPITTVPAPTLSSSPSYCTTAPTGVYIPTYTLFDNKDSPIPPLPCNNGTYATQEGVCCSNGISCADGQCTCPNGTLIYSLPLDPCASINPYYSGCPGNILRDLCCSGPGIFEYAESYSGTMTTPQCWGGATQVWTRTTLPDGEVATSTLPPGLSYTETRCFTCPLYTSSSTSRGAAAVVLPTGLAAADAIIVRFVAVIILVAI